jgi:Bacterial SH3 domain
MMLRRWRWAVGILLAGATLVEARTMTVKEHARLRPEPLRTSAVMRELGPGTKLEVLGESNGWDEVRTADGQHGYVWSAWLTEGASPGKALEGIRPTDAAEARSLADEVHELGQQLGTLLARPQPVTSEDLERLRAEIERVASGEQDLRRWLEDHGTSQPPGDPPPDGSAAVTPGLLLFGGVVGWAASRLLQRRRDRRQRYRLRF